MNVTEFLPHSSTEFDFLKSILEARRPGMSDMTFAGVSREPSSVLSGFLSSATARTSKVARITELSQTIQRRLREPMQQLGRHLDCKWLSSTICVFIAKTVFWRHSYFWLGTISLRFNSHFPGEPGLAGVYW